LADRGIVPVDAPDEHIYNAMQRHMILPIETARLTMTA
jgi:hypothetical protein